MGEELKVGQLVCLRADHSRRRPIELLPALGGVHRYRVFHSPSDIREFSEDQLMAAIEAVVKTLIMPRDNEQEVRYLLDYIRDKVAIKYVSDIIEMLDMALLEE